MSFDRPKIIAVITGVIALTLGIAYLLLVLVLDNRGTMQPAPTAVVAPRLVLTGSQTPITLLPVSHHSLLLHS